MIFISYSKSDDSKWRDDIILHFNGFQNEKILDKIFWHDADIPPGEKWDVEIKKALEKTTIALLLVSKNYLASKYIKKYELGHFLFSENKIQINWFLLDECAWKSRGLRSTQSANPINGKKLMPFKMLEEINQKHHIDTIIFTRCEQVYNRIILNIPSREHSPPPLVREYSDSLIYRCNRSKEMNIFLNSYFKFIDSQNVWYYSVEGEYGDQLSTVYKSILYNKLHLEEKFGNTISTLELNRMIHPDTKDQETLFPFKFTLCEKLGLNHQMAENLNYETIVEMYNKGAREKGKKIILISILVESTSFYIRQYEEIFNWLFEEFQEPVIQIKNVKLIFIFAFQFCDEKDKDKELRRFLNKNKERFIRFGRHKKVTPKDITFWYSEHVKSNSPEFKLYFSDKLNGPMTMETAEKYLADFVQYYNIS